MNLIRFSTLSVCVLFGTTFHLKAQTADELIQKHIAAIGGAEKWKSIKTIKITGSFHAEANAVVLYTTTISNRAGLRKDYTYEATGKSAYVILTPSHGWSYIPQAGLPAKPEPMPDHLVKRNQNTLDIQGPMIDYKSKGNSFTFVGKSTLQGTECYKLKLTPKTGPEQYIYLDTKNYYHVRTTQIMKEHSKEDEEDVVKYSNFKKLPEGIMYAMTLDEGIGEQKVKSVKINVPVDKSTFIPK